MKIKKGRHIYSPIFFGGGGVIERVIEVNRLGLFFTAVAKTNDIIKKQRPQEGLVFACDSGPCN